MSRHAGAFALFALMAVAWSYPLIRHIGDALPGAAIGDNALFAWDFWHMRQALTRSDIEIFATPFLFAPFGADLTLHTHVALLAWSGATLMKRLEVVEALNLGILACLTLNGFCAYLLAVNRFRRWGPAVVAGIIYAGLPYFSTHLLGHFNLIAGWGLPLMALCFLHALESRRLGAALLCGAVSGMIAYVDYYYFVYAIGIALCLLLASSAPITVRVGRERWPPLRYGCIGLAAAALLVMAIVGITGGGVVHIGGLSISATTVRNPLTAVWLLLLAAAWLRWPILPTLSQDGLHRLLAHRRATLAAAAACAVVVAPLAIRAVQLGRAGGYVAPEHFWLSGAPGIDLAAFVLPHPHHSIWGQAVRTAYERFGLNVIEEVGWLGILPVLLAVLGFRRHRKSIDTRIWMTLAAAFLLWSLGPWLQVAGVNVRLPLPQGILSALPLLGNARIPGRGLVVVGLAVAMMAAQYLSTTRRRHLACAVAGVLVLADFVPAPFPLTALSHSSLDLALKGMPPGAVCPIPLGISDGFGEEGRHDNRELLAQITHEHPIVGGSISRAAPGLRERYSADPILGPLLRLSSGAAPDAADSGMGKAETGQALSALGVRYVILNRGTASVELLAYVRDRLPLSLRQVEGERELYVVDEGEE